MSSRPSMTLTAFRRGGGLHSWPEAVAIVLEVSDRVKRGGETHVMPDPDHTVFTDDGSLTILPGSPIPAHPVRQAATLLSDLLRGLPTPAELRELVADNMKDPPACAWLEEFMTALAYFDRPRRPQIVSALGARALLALSRAEGGGHPARPDDIDADDTSASNLTPASVLRFFRRLVRRDHTS